MTWASVAAAAAPPSAPPPSLPAGATTYAVLDANALIGGLARWRGAADVLVTTAAALGEVRDAAARAALAGALGVDLVVREADDASVKKVLHFARLIGELHSISTVDAGVLGLAVALEAAAGRGDRLRTEPPPTRVARRGGRGRRAAAPPGWGAAGGDWAPLDALDEEEAAAERAAGERVREREEAEAAAGRPAAADAADDDAASASSASPSSSDDDGWTVAAKSAAAQRRARRTAARREARAPALAAVAAADGGAEAASDADDGADDDDPAADSPVALVTADFAMQNVALQIGLKLVAPGGARITRAARWALRCSACAATSRDPTRVFCPKCGGATLDKVEVVVGPDGGEVVGVRKQHCLRGTRFSLPKPRGGKGSKDPILREDVLLAKTRAAGRTSRRREVGGSAAAAADPFAPEAADDAAWLAPRGPAAGGPGARGGGVTAFLPGWKNNPNESRPHGRRSK